MRRIILTILGIWVLTASGCIGTIRSVTVAYNEVEIKVDLNENRIANRPSVYR